MYSGLKTSNQVMHWVALNAAMCLQQHVLFSMLVISCSNDSEVWNTLWVHFLSLYLLRADNFMFFTNHFFFLAAVKTEMSVSISGVIHMVSHGSMRHWRDELLKLPNTPFLNKSLSKQLWKILVKKRDTERESLTGREIFNSALLSQHYRSEY